MWFVVVPSVYVLLLQILVTVLSFDQAPLCLWMCVSHYHVRINVTLALSIFLPYVEHFRRIFAALEAVENY